MKELNVKIQALSYTKRMPLTPDQETKVKRWRKKIPVRQIAEKLGVPRSRVYSLLYSLKLDFIKTQSPRNIKKSFVPEGYFDPFGFKLLGLESWVI